MSSGSQGKSWPKNVRKSDCALNCLYPARTHEDRKLGSTCGSARLSQLFLPFSIIHALAEINQELKINYYLLVVLIILTNQLETVNQG